MFWDSSCRFPLLCPPLLGVFGMHVAPSVFFVYVGSDFASSFFFSLGLSVFSSLVSLFWCWGGCFGMHLALSLHLLGGGSSDAYGEADHSSTTRSISLADWRLLVLRSISDFIGYLFFCGVLRCICEDDPSGRTTNISRADWRLLELRSISSFLTPLFIF